MEKKQHYRSAIEELRPRGCLAALCVIYTVMYAARPRYNKTHYRSPHMGLKQGVHSTVVRARYYQVYSDHVYITYYDHKSSQVNDPCPLQRESGLNRNTTHDMYLIRGSVGA